MSTGLWLLVVFSICLNLVEGVAILALAREIGLLTRRLPPAPALISEEGPGVGNALPAFDVIDLASGTARAIESGFGRPAVLFFLASRCKPCLNLLDDLEAVAGDWPEVEMVPIMSSPSRGEAKAVYERSTYRGPLFVDRGAAMSTVGVTRTPHALLVSADGVVQAQGIVNNREMVGSLIEGRLRQQTAGWVDAAGAER